MNFPKSLLTMSSLVLTLIILIGCGGGSSSTIRIATIAPMTGESAKMGEDMSQAVQLAVDQLNAKGGLLGKKIELLIEDDRADPKDAVSVAAKVVAQGAVAVIGHYNSSCTIPASNLYNEAGIIMITPASTNPMVTDRGYPGVFRTCGRDDQQGKVQAEFAVRNLQVKKVAILHDKTTYGQGLADEFRKNLTPNVQVTINEGVTRGDKDFSAILTRVKASEPELLMFGGVYVEGGLLAKQMKDLGLACALISGDGVFDPEFIRIGGEAAEGAYLSYAPSADNIPSAKVFLDSYKARWPEVGPYCLFSYDAAMIIFDAIKSTGTTSGVKVADYIHHTTFNVASGAISYDAKGDPTNSPYVMWTVKNGKLTPL
jgi:branched-chain amino acid transport system substrate-binding protein